MSNKIVPVVYRSIVDDVMSNIRSEFEEFGIGDQVLQELQTKWELKILHSNVAEFEKPTGSQPQQQQQPPPPQHAAYSSMPPIPGPPPRYGEQAPHLPPPQLPPPLAGPPPASGIYARTPAPSAANTLPPLQSYSGSMNQLPPIKSESPRPNMHQIPQLDGPSVASSQDDDSGSSEGSPSPPSKSVPLPSIKRAPAPGAAVEGSQQEDDDAIIGSDLDDSDDEDNGEQDDEEIEGGSKVLCTYDRVQRVKNKWKCVLKDGMVHINGKDYLFSKCTGEFEW